MAVTKADQMDTDSFKAASAGCYDWFKKQLVSGRGMSETAAQTYVDAFTQSESRKE